MFANHSTVITIVDMMEHLNFTNPLNVILTIQIYSNVTEKWQIEVVLIEMMLLFNAQMLILMMNKLLIQEQFVWWVLMVNQVITEKED
jgi:hypothetical protein